MGIEGFDVVIRLEQYMPYGLLFVFMLAVWALVWLWMLQRKWRMFFRRDGVNMEEILRAIRAHQDASDTDRRELRARVDTVEQTLPKAIRHMGLVRFNPFSDAGGDQSFAIALLDGQKNGVVISSLYGREINRVYAKSVESGASKHQLSEDEKEAIARATRS
ncbi:hypothetical protein A3J56_00520 [Candidatus Giovannonibacteria bacterium RIFCSPHIGHO2_02_FULL_46_20]|uniref:DUF4446 domain-containing protein n=1 Tax=Candidatus Giovannonibacteria bacterium RIFCSPHIGHO2_02_FULL_46_20 TaxID=1798338 RepID=A0A1F5WDB9_9BACT|nr:MAG: hypothetical protein A3J56_00520 [Candidatus Giovannonibacteria bacterium RIFCSPHIGHO2_02_FULL_46_20]